MAAGGLIIGGYVWGAMSLNRPWHSKSTVAKLAQLSWALAYSVLALFTWILLRTQSWAARFRTGGGWAIWMLLIGILAT